jgi:hypothetical protein
MAATKGGSRMRRVSSGKRVELTVRDVEPLKRLDRYHDLSPLHLHAFLGGKSPRFKGQLSDRMMTAGCISRGSSGNSRMLIHARHRRPGHEGQERVILETRIAGSVADDLGRRSTLDLDELLEGV